MTSPDHSSRSGGGGDAPRSLGALFSQQAHTLGHRPFLTFYDDATGERTELSYATFDNWASKAANLLAEDFDAGRSTRVAVLADAHWTAAVTVVAAWKVGAAVRLDRGTAGASEVLVVAEADAGAAADHPRLLVLGAGMGGRLQGSAPGLGFGDEVLAFADDYDDPAVSLDDAAVSDPAGEVTQGTLLRQAQGAVTATDRVLATAPLSAAGIAALLVAPALAGASLVWCPRSSADLTARMAAERVSAVLAGDGSIRPA